MTRIALRTIIVAVAALELACTGPLVPVIEIDEQTSTRLRAGIPVLEERALAEAPHTRLEELEATSCKLLLWDAAATADNAVDQLRYQAELLGANAVADVHCDPMEDTSMDKKLLELGHL